MPCYCKGEACAGGNKVAHYGVKGSRKKHWCATCAKEHGGVLLGKRQMCEDCQVKQASCGEEGNKKRWWCGTCATALACGRCGMWLCCHIA